jgi:hypothetical protein
VRRIDGHSERLKGEYRMGAALLRGDRVALLTATILEFEEGHTRQVGVKKPSRG